MNSTEFIGHPERKSLDYSAITSSQDLQNSFLYSSVTLQQTSQIKEIESATTADKGATETEIRGFVEKQKEDDDPYVEKLKSMPSIGSFPLLHFLNKFQKYQKKIKIMKVADNAQPK